MRCLLYLRKCVGQRLNMVMIFHVRAVTSWGTMVMQGEVTVKCEVSDARIKFLGFFYNFTKIIWV